MIGLAGQEASHPQNKISSTFPRGQARGYSLKITAVDYLVVEQAAHCPACAEPITLLLDLSAGAQSYIEDCEVCCRPMQVTFAVVDGQCTALRVDYA